MIAVLREASRTGVSVCRQLCVVGRRPGVVRCCLVRPAGVAVGLAGERRIPVQADGKVRAVEFRGNFGSGGNRDRWAVSLNCGLLGFGTSLRAGPGRGPLAQTHCSAEDSAEKLGTGACVRYLVLHGTG